MNDILLEDNNDVLIENGDFVIGDSTAQEVENIIMSFPGWWKQYPLMGCSAPSFINSPGNCETLRSNIQVQLPADGKQISSFSYSFNANGELVININGQTITVGS